MKTESDRLAHAEVLNHPDSRACLLGLFETPSFRERWRRFWRGLHAPRDSGDARYARLQLLRLSAPLLALLIPLLLVLALVMLVAHEPPPTVAVIEMVNPEVAPPLDPVPPLPPPVDQPPVTPPELPAEALAGAELEDPGAEVPPMASAAPVDRSAVSLIRSRLVFENLQAQVRAGGAQQAVRGINGSSAATERTVMLALRWLKHVQEPDGSWTQASGGGPAGAGTPAMTGLALLTFLAHGETPKSEEFGPTVERALRWLLAQQTPDGDFRGADAHNYSQPIAAYALCEAAALTLTPQVREAATVAAARIVRGQNPHGHLWNYNFDSTAGLAPGHGTERNDLSYAGWCIQALKAAAIAGLRVEGLEASLSRAVAGMRRLGRAGGDSRAYSFGYTGAGEEPITSAGALCMQLLGEARSREVRGALNWLNRVDCVWEKPWSDNPVYHWYYVTQVKFHAGGGQWTAWNDQFSDALVRNQQVLPAAIADLDGKLVDVGYWKPAGPREYSQSLVYTTTLCALQLQVYYRHLPTFKTPAVVADGGATLEDVRDDIPMEVL